MKQLISCILAVAMLSVAMIGACWNVSAEDSTATSNQAKAYLTTDDTITLDGNLTEWEGTEKYPLSVRQADGSFATSEDEYVSFKWTPGRFYFAIVSKDGGKTVDGLIRDQVRIGIVLPDGKTFDLFYGDSDGWYCRQKDLAGWWGTAGTTEAISADNSMVKYVYGDNGTVTAEGSVKLNDTYQDQLRHKAVVKVCISYFDKQTCNSGAYDGDHWAKWGISGYDLKSTADVTGSVQLYSEKPATTTIQTVANKIADGAVVEIDGDFSDWDKVEKNYMDVRQDDGSFKLSDSEYCQFQWAYGFFYFRVVSKDGGMTKDGVIRDQVRLGLALPDGHFGLFYGDSDNWFCRENEAAGWWNTTGTSETTQADNTMSKTVYGTDGTVSVEGKVHLIASLSDALDHNVDLKVCLSYFDNQACNGATYSGDHWAKWGIGGYYLDGVESISGVVKLVDPTYQDTDGIQVLPATAGAKNTGYSFDKDDNMTVKWQAFEGAVSYQVNIFDRWDADYIINKYVVSETTTALANGLEHNGDYGYQVTALNADGKVIAAYPVVNFVCGTNGDANPTTSTTSHQTTTSDDPKPNESTPEVPNTDTGSASAAGLVFLMLASMTVVLGCKKKMR